tara:strand:- start:180 stop:353 length:174 start_codon:yes stop_codon:yes gene_type:complete
MDAPYDASSSIKVNKKMVQSKYLVKKALEHQQQLREQIRSRIANAQDPVSAENEYVD